MFSTIRQEPKWNWTVLNMHNLAAEDELQYLEKYFQGFSFWRFPSHVIKNRIESFDADGVHFSLNTISKMAMVSVSFIELTLMFTMILFKALAIGN